MAGYLAQVFSAVRKFNKPTQQHLPMLNSISNSLSGYLQSVNQVRKKKTFMRWYKLIPELTALVNKVARDIIHRYHFEPLDPRETSRNKILKVNKFSQEIELRSIMFSQVVDMLAVGEGYGWLGKISESQAKEALKEILKREIFLNKIEKKEISEKLLHGFTDTNAIDEDILAPRKYRYMASTTMENIHGPYDMINYRQIVGMEEEFFSPKEIIRYTLMEVDGKVEGFTPVESIMVQLELLRQMWQNMASLHKNGGAPDKVFALENIHPGSASYERVKEQLQKYKLVENKHGNMLFTGKLTVHDLQQLDEMQFKDMGLYITGLMAMQWQIPRSSIPYIIGGTNTKDDTGGNSEKGYWRNIEFAQMVFEESMNTQLWIPYFGVKLVFDNTFVQQDVQVQTARQLRLNNILLENQLLGIGMKQLAVSTIQRELGRTDDEIEEKKEDPLLMGEPQSTMNQQLSKNEVNDSSDKANIRKRKKREQQNLADRGQKPNGVSKELKCRSMDIESDLEYKQIIGQEDIDVDFQMFISLYNEDKTISPGKPPRVFIRQNEEYTALKFKSSDFVYRTIIPTQVFLEDQIAMLNLNVGDNIYRL